MQLLLPQNIFSRLIADHLPEDLKSDIEFHPSSVLSNELKKSLDAVALIPAMDLITHKDFFISGKHGLSFENVLCNSYLYYSNSQQKDIRDIYLYGDISSQEVILSKILFKELYDIAVEMHLLADNDLSNKNLIISGDSNFIEDRFSHGISLAEEVIENINLPYVNYVFAAGNNEVIGELHSLINDIEEHIYKAIQEKNFGNGFSETSADYIRSNISSVIINFEQQDIEGLEQLLRLPYFYGMIKNIVEVKFVE